MVEVGRIPETAPQGEAGLLGVAVSPDFDRDHLLYFYVCTAEDNRVVRAELDGNQLGETEPILTGIPGGFIHDGGRLEFGPDGFLYVSTGETGEDQLARERDRLRRQDPAHHHLRRPGTGQPVRRRGVVVGPPQRAGPGVRRRRPAVGERVRLRAASTSST